MLTMMSRAMEVCVSFSRKKLEARLPSAVPHALQLLSSPGTAPRFHETLFVDD